MVTNSPITSALLRKCQERGECATTTMVCQGLGAAIDAGVIELGELLALVKSCSTAAELADALTMVAASAQLQPEGGDVWNR